MSKNVLIIEDDKFLTNDLELILEVSNTSTKIINDVDKLISIKNFDIYDCIFLDIMMRTKGEIPMNNFTEAGEAAYFYIREISKNIPIFIISAMDKEDINVDFNKDNVKYIKKPFESMEQVLELVDSI